MRRFCRKCPIIGGLRSPGTLLIEDNRAVPGRVVGMKKSEVFLTSDFRLVSAEREEHELFMQSALNQSIKLNISVK